MMAGRFILGLVIGFIILAFGLFRVFTLAQYNASAQGTITQFFTVDTNSTILGLTFADKSAQANVFFQSKSGKTYNFTITESKQGGPNTKLDLTPGIHIQVRYSLIHPEMSMIEKDLQNNQYIAYGISICGIFIIIISFLIPWWMDRNSPARGSHRPSRH